MSGQFRENYKRLRGVNNRSTNSDDDILLKSDIETIFAASSGNFVSGDNITVVANANGKLEFSSSSAGLTTWPTTEETLTGVSTSRQQLTANDAGKIFNNNGASVTIYADLPTPAEGMGAFIFIVTDNTGLNIGCPTGGIRIGTTEMTGGSRWQSSTVGSTIVLIPVGTTRWWAIATQGTWGTDT